MKVIVTVKAKRRLTHPEIDHHVRSLCSQIETAPDWRPGKATRARVEKDGRTFAIGLDWRASGYHVLIGLDKEIVSPKGGPHRFR